MPYYFVADSFHMKKLPSRLFSAKCDFIRKTAVLRFEPLPLKSLGVTYNDHIRLIGKRVKDVLLVLIEPFSVGVTAEALRTIIG